MVKVGHGKSQSQHTSKPNGSISIPKKEYTSHIIERMKLANPNRSRIIPRQGG